MDVRYTIPEKYLDKLWSEILEHANNFTGEGKVAADAFSEPFLVVSAHGLKLSTKEDTCAATCEGFRTHLNQCFHIDAGQFAWEDCWLDLRVEDVPCTNNGGGITLLRKTHCLDNWADRLSYPNSKSFRTKINYYP